MLRSRCPVLQAQRLLFLQTRGRTEELRDRLGKLQVALVGLEATGGYETVVAASLSAASLPVVVVKPAQVRAFAKALGKRAKTDPIDAAVIAHFVEATKPDVRSLPDEATRQLSDLVTRRKPDPGDDGGRAAAQDPST